MADEGDVRADAMQLLWAMHKHREGTLVHPSEAAHEAELIPGTDRYKATVAYLVNERAIEPDEETSGVSITDLEEPFYRITPHGMAMLSGFMPN